ncbi:MAG: formyl transferase [Pseudomonadota bacterium]
MALTSEIVESETTTAPAAHGGAAARVASAELPDHTPDPARLAAVRKTTPGDVVVLIGPGDLPAIMVNALHDAFGELTVIREQKQPTSFMIKRRVKMLGVVATVGQVAFGLLLTLIHKRSAPRKLAIIAEAGLCPVLDTSRVTIHDVASVNAAACRSLLQHTAPRVVIVVGTRMISKATLDAIDAPVINYHAGLNPTYRGMNGGYWALANGDAEGAGVTVHLVDPGVDTGAPLYWRRFTATSDDSFVTYPLLQADIGRALLVGAAQDAIDGTLTPQSVPLRSAQWFHPTLWGYLWTGVRKGVW